MQVMPLSWDKKSPESTESNLIIVDDEGNSVGVKLIGNEKVLQPVIDKLNELSHEEEDHVF